MACSEHNRRSVHGGSDSHLSVEVAAVRFEADESVTVCDADPGAAMGFGVYVRNPLAFHVQDFGPATVDPERTVTLAEAKVAAFKWADALADHLGCPVVSRLERPA